MDSFDQMIDEIEMLCKSNKIRKCSLKSQDSIDGKGDNDKEGEGEDGDIDEEKICNICCYFNKNTYIVPCGHLTC